MTATPAAAGLPADLHPAEADWARVERYLGEQRALSTRKVYRSSVEKFARWCAERGLSPLPASPQSVAMFLAAEADLGIRPATLARHVAAIRAEHLAAGDPDPTQGETVRALKRGIVRTLGKAQAKKQPATVERLRCMVEALPATLRGRRERAILLLGFAGAFRRSELAGLTVEDLEIGAEGLRVTLRSSKTDQVGRGQIVHVARGESLCPVQALADWLEAPGIGSGLVFRRISKSDRVLEAGLTPHAISEIVKACAERAGFEREDFAGHSLRSGFLTSAARNGASIWQLMDVSRHRHVDAVRGYVRDAQAYRDYAGAGLL